jgi:hypothetical protein
MQYDFNVPANGGQVIDVKGKFFKYKSGTGLIRVRINKGGYVDLLPGQGVWGVDFDTLTMQDRSGAGNAGAILAGEFDFHDDRIAGTVDVVDGGKARTLSGAAYCGGTAVISAAAQFSAVQLYNPSATKRLIIKALALSVTNSQQLSVFGYATPLTGAPQSAASKLIGGGAASVGELRTQSLVAALSLPALIGPYITTNVPFIYVFQEPVVLLQGQGMVIQGSTPNTYCGATFEYIEETI